MLTITKQPDKTILKRGKKVYAEITYNENPDYKFVLWFKGGMALSGFETEQAAIDRANEMNQAWEDAIN